MVMSGWGLPGLLGLDGPAEYLGGTSALVARKRDGGKVDARGGLLKGDEGGTTLVERGP
jgi:hypothetical protein